MFKFECFNSIMKATVTFKYSYGKLGVAVVFLKRCDPVVQCVKSLLKMAPANTEKTKPLTFYYLNRLLLFATGHTSHVNFATSIQLKII